jgi:hypothetical protein
MGADKQIERELVYLFSSAARTPYVRDILNAICLPEDYILQFRYLPTWVDPAFLNDPAALREELDGRQGLIVFADMPGGSAAIDYKFYPIRLVRIVNPHFVGPVLYVPMVLGEFVDYGRIDSGRAEAWHTQIASFSKSPKITGDKDRRDNFIFKERVDSRQYKVTGSTPMPNWQGAETGWESVVERIGSTDRFLFSTFFRILGLYDDKGQKLRPKRDKHRTWYKLNFDTAFSIGLSFYHDRRQAQYIEGRTLRIVGNSDLFSGDIGRVMPADYQYNHIDVRLLTRRRFETDYTNLRIEAGSWTPSTEDVAGMVNRFAKYLVEKAEGKELESVKDEAKERIKEAVDGGRFFVAQPELVMELGMRWSTVLIAAMLLITGNVLLALPPDALKHAIEFFVGQQPSIVAWAAFVRTVGGLSTFFALIYVFHKWPLK